MAQRNKANFKSTKNSSITTNGTGAITGAIMNSILEDIADSLLFIDDHFIDEDSFASDSATKVPSQQSVKAYVGPAERVRTVTKQLTTAEILNANSSPVELVAAPGSGYALIPLNVIGDFKYASAPFATNTTVNIRHGTVSAFVLGASPISGSVSRVVFQGTGGTGTPDRTAIDNQNINFFVTGGNPTGGGTSTLRITLHYAIIPLH